MTAPDPSSRGFRGRPRRAAYDERLTGAAGFKARARTDGPKDRAKTHPRLPCQRQQEGWTPIPAIRWYLKIPSMSRASVLDAGDGRDLLGDQPVEQLDLQ